MLPLVPEMLEALQEEMAQFQRLVTYWPQFGPALESSMCTVLRDATGATSRLCGLIQVLPVCRLMQLPANCSYPPSAREAAAANPSGQMWTRDLWCSRLSVCVDWSAQPLHAGATRRWQWLFKEHCIARGYANSW